MENNTLPGNTSLPSPDSYFESMKKQLSGSGKYSIEDFFKNPEKTNFKISPDGNNISYLSPYERRKNIFIQQRANKQITQISFETKRDIMGYAWANGHRLIYVMDQDGDENYQLYAVDKDGKNHKNLTPFEKVVIQIIDSLPDIEEEMIIGMNKNNPMLFEPYRINIVTGELTQLAVNDNPAEPIDHWMTDNDGKLRLAGKVVDGINNTIMYRSSEDDEFTEVLTTTFEDSFAPSQFHPENKDWVYTISNLGQDKSALILFDMKKKKQVGDVIFQHDKVDLGGIIWSRKNKKLIGVSYAVEKQERHFFDERRVKLMSNWKSLLPGLEVSVTSHDRDERCWMLRSYSDKSLGAYYLYDEQNDSLEHISDVSPWIDEADMSDMQPISYKSRDGLTIPAYLTVPKDSDGKGLPVIIHPHGGPWVRDNWGYNPAVQLFAQQGYAVLQMNYRGSTGYGKEYWKKSFKQWGKTMQDDITDGVQYLIDQGIADPSKIAIYGGSYGGYATLAGITFTPDIYCCAVDYVGVSNLFTFMNTMPPYWQPYVEIMHKMVGDPETDKAQMESASPVFHVDKIKTPLFVAQGANDPRVNIDESDQIVTSLRERGIDVPYMVKYDEGHGFVKEENRFDFYYAMLGFMKKYLG